MLFINAPRVEKTYQPKFEVYNLLISLLKRFPYKKLLVFKTLT